MLTRIADTLRKLIPDVRFQIVRLAYVAVKQHVDWEYLEVRPLVVAWPGYGNAELPVKADCSWFVKCLFWRAGARSPMKDNYGPDGNSVTLYECGKKITLSELRGGDVATFGPNGETHAAVIVVTDADPICVSDGRPGAPEIVSVSELVQSIYDDGNEPMPVTYLRFSTRNRRLG